MILLILYFAATTIYDFTRAHATQKMAGGMLTSVKTVPKDPKKHSRKTRKHSHSKATHIRSKKVEGKKTSKGGKRTSKNGKKTSKGHKKRGSRSVSGERKSSPRT
ncbi:hypothetical protein L596_023983 [Steinernema carpocapsae]|uniref:Uncharacterized protein n=1 Tax=Steinernema carpocapsae TaxID=34508 RepID=A0A4U5MFC0_STECR|nr:hypothetical protein L596_023983 [Steinernema carpocapsae]